MKCDCFNITKTVRLSRDYFNLTKQDFDKLKELSEYNKRGEVTPYDEIIDGLLEKVIVYEYNDGTFKKVNPVVELSEIYQQSVRN
jgi:hypothetical protein